MATRRKTPGRDFTAGALPYFYRHRGSTGDEELDKRIRELVRETPYNQNPELIEELIITAFKLAQDRVSVSDLKMINRAVREMRDAARIFSPYASKRKVVVFGSARTPLENAESQAALKFAEKMVAEGFMVITGAGDGIMGAAQRGAGRDSSFGLNIKLPFEQGANETIGGDGKLVTFNYFFTRKVSFVKEAEAFALFPGGFGTMDELFEALTLIQTGKASVVPVVMVESPGGSYWYHWADFVRAQLLDLKLISPEDLALFRITDNINEAVDEILRFYRVFHSYRHVGTDLVFRLNFALSETKLAALNSGYRDLLASGDFRQGSALPAEANEPELAAMPRLIFHSRRRSFGRLRELIDEINRAD
jgi:uncharacterized protein (TIGR00730 family)